MPARVRSSQAECAQGAIAKPPRAEYSESTELSAAGAATLLLRFSKRDSLLFGLRAGALGNLHP